MKYSWKCLKTHIKFKLSQIYTHFTNDNQFWRVWNCWKEKQGKYLHLALRIGKKKLVGKADVQRNLHVLKCFAQYCFISRLILWLADPDGGSRASVQQIYFMNIVKHKAIYVFSLLKKNTAGSWSSVTMIWHWFRLNPNQPPSVKSNFRFKNAWSALAFKIPLTTFLGLKTVKDCDNVEFSAVYFAVYFAVS